MKIQVDTDIGLLKLALTVIISGVPITRSKIESALSEISQRGVHSIIVDERKVFTYLQVLYPVYLAIRGEITGVKIARKVEMNLLCYMACTDRIRDAVDVLTIRDSGSRLLVISFCRDCEDEVLLRTHMSVVKKLCQDVDCDLIVGVSCLRLDYEKPPACSSAEDKLDYMESVAVMLARRFE